MLYFVHVTVDDCDQCDIHAICVKGACRCRIGYKGDGFQCVKGKLLYRPATPYSFVFKRSRSIKRRRNLLKVVERLAVRLTANLRRLEGTCIDLCTI